MNHKKNIMKKEIIILITICLFLSFLSSFVSADIGPKPPAPSTDFHVTYDRNEISDFFFKAVILDCGYSVNANEEECILYSKDITFCQNSNCHFEGIPKEFMLTIYLPSQNKTYFSDATLKKSSSSTFEANLLLDGTILIEETTPFIGSYAYETIITFLIALILTLLLELFVALIFTYIAKIPKEVLISVFVVNILSLPIVWFIFPLIIKGPNYHYYVYMILSAEIFAFIFEGYFLYILNKKLISLKKLFLLSFLMNLVSFIIGGLIFITLVQLLKTLLI